jgi:hypothetical protein
LQVLLVLSRLAVVLASTAPHYPDLLPLGSSSTVSVHINANDSDIIIATIMTLGLLSAQQGKQLQVHYVPKGDATYQACDIR